MDSGMCYTKMDDSSMGMTHPITAALSMLPLIPTLLNRTGLSAYLPSSSWFTLFLLLPLVSCMIYIMIRLLQWGIAWTQQQPVYIMEFSTYKAPEEWRVTSEKFMEHARTVFNFSEEALTFSEKILKQSGLGQETAFPPGILANPPNLSMSMARAEAETVMFGCLDDLFARTHTHPSQVDILIVNCSLFAPTPSLAAMIINHYGMRDDIEAYNLGGMGCSAGLISINLAKDLLQVHKNSICIVVSTENITQNIYLGKERGMQISNTLFRVGGAAIMLSNMKTLPHSTHTTPSVLSLNGANVHGLFSSAPAEPSGTHARYQLQHVIRTHMGAKNDCYNVVFQDDDSEGCTGVRLGKELMNVAGKALRQNITRLAPKILPWSEQVRFALHEVKRMIQRTMGKKPSPSYTPNFKKAVQHFCIHAGGRGVIDAIQTNLSLSDDDVAPSRATLKRYGNTSSSSIWYEFEFLAQNDRLKHGDKIWQIAFGSGFKCNSAVWKVL